MCSIYIKEKNKLKFIAQAIMNGFFITPGKYECELFRATKENGQDHGQRHHREIIFLRENETPGSI